MPALLDLTGQRFTRLTVLGRAGLTGNRHPAWRCRCDCGNITVVGGGELRTGNTRSCGCYRRDVMPELSRKNSTTHGHSVGSLANEFRIWVGMIMRCTNPKDTSYSNYGGRGIVVCERWRSFDDFIADVGPRPSRRHSIDRHPNNDGDYEPANVRWATDVEQARNKRNNRILIVRGVRMTLSEAVLISPLKTAASIHARLRRGWPEESAVLAPLRTPKPR